MEISNSSALQSRLDCRLQCGQALCVHLGVFHPVEVHLELLNAVRLLLQVDRHDKRNLSIATSSHDPCVRSDWASNLDLALLHRKLHLHRVLGSPGMGRWRSEACDLYLLVPVGWRAWTHQLHGLLQLLLVLVDGLDH